jgi:hypothetical protein
MNRRDFISSLIGAFTAYAATRAQPKPKNPVIEGWADGWSGNRVPYAYWNETAVESETTTLLLGNIDPDGDFLLEEFGLGFNPSNTVAQCTGFLDSHSVRLEIDRKTYFQAPAMWVPFEGTQRIDPPILIPAGARVKISCHGDPIEPVKIWSQMRGAKIYRFASEREREL